MFYIIQLFFVLVQWLIRPFDFPIPSFYFIIFEFFKSFYLSLKYSFFFLYVNNWVTLPLLLFLSAFFITFLFLLFAMKILGLLLSLTATFEALLTFLPLFLNRQATSSGKFALDNRKKKKRILSQLWFLVLFFFFFFSVVFHLTIFFLRKAPKNHYKTIIY